MNTELHKMVDLPMLESIHDASTIDIDVVVTDDFNNIKYTSLKDIIPNSPNYDGSIGHEANNFNSSNITIRNQLVKQAASAYLQSAAVLVRGNQNCLVGIWHKMMSRSALRSTWRVYVQNPFHACFGCVVSEVCRFVAHMANWIGRWKSNCLRG